MRCLKYLSPVIMLVFNLAYWLGFHYECVCRNSKSYFEHKSSIFDHIESIALFAVQKTGRNRAKRKNESRLI